MNGEKVGDPPLPQGRHNLLGDAELGNLQTLMNIPGAGVGLLGCSPVLVGEIIDGVLGPGDIGGPEPRRRASVEPAPAGMVGEGKLGRRHRQRGGGAWESKEGGEEGRRAWGGGGGGSTEEGVHGWVPLLLKP